MSLRDKYKKNKWPSKKPDADAAMPMKRPGPPPIVKIDLPPVHNESTDSMAAFDTAWALKPVNPSHAPQIKSQAKEAWAAAVSQHTLPVVVTAVKAWAIFEMAKEHPRNLATFLSSGEIPDYAEHATTLPTPEDEVAFETAYKLYPAFKGKDLPDQQLVRQNHYLRCIKPDDRLAFLLAVKEYAESDPDPDYTQLWSTFVGGGWKAENITARLGKLLAQALSGGGQCFHSVRVQPGETARNALECHVAMLVTDRKRLQAGWDALPAYVGAGPTVKILPWEGRPDCVPGLDAFAGQVPDSCTGRYLVQRPKDVAVDVAQVLETAAKVAADPRYETPARIAARAEYLADRAEMAADKRVDDYHAQLEVQARFLAEVDAEAHHLAAEGDDDEIFGRPLRFRADRAKEIRAMTETCPQCSRVVLLAGAEKICLCLRDGYGRVVPPGHRLDMYGDAVPLESFLGHEVETPSAKRLLPVAVAAFDMDSLTYS